MASEPCLKSSPTTDYEKAYDRVSHKWLQHVLLQAGIPDTIISAIMDMNKGTTQLIINNTLSTAIPLHSGVKQGYPYPQLYSYSRYIHSYKPYNEQE